MHVALFGAGRMGQVHAQTLARHADVERLSIVDANRDLAVAVAERVGAEARQEPAATIAAQADAVVVASATSAHADLVRLAADAGRPVFCEKPLSTSMGTTDELLSVVERAGVELQVGYMRRFDTGFRAARDRVVNGELGRLLMVRATAYDHEAPPPGYIAVSGGIHVDLMVHDFDVARWLTGREVAEVYATGAALTGGEFEDHDDVDAAVVLLRMDDGTPFVICATRVDPLGYDYRLEVLGTGDSVAVGLDERMPLHPLGPTALTPTGVPYDGFITRWPDAYRAEMEAFVDLVAGRGENLCPGDNDRQALAIALAADRSRRERRPVSPVGVAA